MDRFKKTLTGFFKSKEVTLSPPTPRRGSSPAILDSLTAKEREKLHNEFIRSGTRVRRFSETPMPDRMAQGMLRALPPLPTLADAPLYESIKESSRDRAVYESPTPFDKTKIAKTRRAVNLLQKDRRDLVAAEGIRRVALTSEGLATAATKYPGLVETPINIPNTEDQTDQPIEKGNDLYYDPSFFEDKPPAMLEVRKI